MRDRFLSLMLIVCMLVAGRDSFAFSADYLLLPDEDAIKQSYDIVEGEVVRAVYVPGSYFYHPCFNYLYKLKVWHSLKGSFQVGDVLSVGITRYGQSVADGDRQLVIVKKPSKYSYEHCTHRNMNGLFRRMTIYTQYAGKVGLFNITTNKDGLQEFKAETCSEGDQLMYEDFFKDLGFPVKKETRGKRECKFMIAPYPQLYNKITSDLKSLQPPEDAIDSKAAPAP